MLASIIESIDCNQLRSASVSLSLGLSASLPDSAITVTSVERPLALQVIGRMVETADDAVINAYDLMGRLVVKGHGTILLPAAGTYIVKSGNSTSKIICR